METPGAWLPSFEFNPDASEPKRGVTFPGLHKRQMVRSRAIYRDSIPQSHLCLTSLPDSYPPGISGCILGKRNRRNNIKDHGAQSPKGSDGEWLPIFLWRPIRQSFQGN